jgi:hypothetical protein
MTKKEAKKVAYRRARLILLSALDAGWTPSENGAFSYSVFDAKRIVDALEEICASLKIRARGNLEENGTTLNRRNLQKTAAFFRGRRGGEILGNRRNGKDSKRE